MASIEVWSGPSELTGEPIVALLSGIPRAGHHPSSNEKTGPMLQLWILRVDMSPIDAVAARADEAICGSCIHRPQADGSRSCYVALRAPQAVWRAWKRGNSPRGDLSALKGRHVRLGAYGDPAALPEHILGLLCSLSSGRTGYTHEWKRYPNLKRYLMASVDSAAEMLEARRLGWRTFRVRSAEEPLVYFESHESASRTAAREIACPASPEAGQKTQCDTCLLCDGTPSGLGRANIAIVVHGVGKKHFEGARTRSALRVIQ